MLIGLTPARTDFFTGFMLKKLLHLFLNLVFLKKVFEVTLFYGTYYSKGAAPAPAPPGENVAKLDTYPELNLTFVFLT